MFRHREHNIEAGCFFDIGEQARPDAHSCPGRPALWCTQAACDRGIQPLRSSHRFKEGIAMRLLGSLVFLIGTLCLGAYAYFPHTASHYARFAEVTYVRIGDNQVGRLSFGTAKPIVTALRTFSPGPKILAHAEVLRPKVFSVSMHASQSANSTFEDTATARAATTDPGSDERQAPSDRGDQVWRTATAVDNVSLRHAAPKRDDDQARYELIRNVQSELLRVGCYLGNVDGDWGPASKRAAGQFLRKVNASLPVEKPDYILLTLIQSHSHKTCGVECPSGRGLSSNGRCVPTMIVNRGRLPERKTFAASDTKGANKQAWITVAADTAQPLLPERARLKATNVRAGDTTPLGTITGDRADRSADVAKIPTRHAAPLPGMMSVGAPVHEPQSLQGAPAYILKQADQQQFQPDRRTLDEGVRGLGTSHMRNHRPVGPAIERPQRETHAQKPRKANGQRRARSSNRETVRTFAGRVRRGSPQHNLMLSLGGVF